MQKTASYLHTYAAWYTLILLIILAFVLYSVVQNENRKGILTFAVLNVGQGDALYIESPTGTQVIVDGGPGKALMREVAKVAPWYDRSIDMIVVTNPDKDHYEGFIPLLKKYSVETALLSGTNSETDTFAYLENLIADKGVERIVALRGQKIDLGGGAYLEVFFPDREVSGLSSNSGSIVMRLVYGETSVMLQGDSVKAIEDYLVGMDGASLKSTILKAGHHGSKTSNTEEYLRLVDPEWAVVSAGRDNSYGHPHAEVLNTMDNLGIEALGTCTGGRIVFESDGKTFTLKNKNPKEITAGCKTQN